MGEKKQDTKNSYDSKFKHLDIDVTNVASSMDYTGLIPANPQLTEQMGAYKEIHDFGTDTAERVKDLR